jgi:hypothetical protein
MSWPLSQDYNEAIQNPAGSFSDPELKRGQPVTNALGLPMPRSGNFADVYEVNCPATGNKWAVKCFTRQVAGQAQRYSEISRHLEHGKLPFGVDFQYQTKGILIRGQWYPILKMRWIAGMLLNDFVRDQANNPVLLHALTQIWLRMSKRLREVGIAHADLQHGNVILVPGSKMQSLAVKLIDYDGMYVPALAGKKSGEVGHPNYQHPQRIREGTYSPEVDRFPLLVVATALRALELGGRSLWERYDNGDNLLFKEGDLRNPAGSPLFAELRQASDPLLRTLAGRLEQACQFRLEAAPLVEELIPEERRKGQVGAEEAAAANVWDFGDSEPVRKVTPRRRKKGVPAWAWVASGAATVLLAGGAVFLATRLAEPDGKALARQAAQSNGSPETSQRPAAANPAAPTTHPTRPPEDPLAKTGPPQVAGPVMVGDPAGVKDPLSPLEPDPVRPPDRPVVEPPPPGPPAVVFEKPAMFPPRLLRGLSAGDNRLAMTDGANNWRLMDWTVFKPVRKFVGHQGPVTCIAVTADRQRALTGSEDKTLRLWDLNTGECLSVFRGHRNAVADVALSADGTKALSTDGGANAWVWDLAKGKPIASLGIPRPVTAVALSPDGTRCAIGTAPAEGGQAPTLLLFDTEKYVPLRVQTGHTDVITSLAFSPDTAQLVSGSKDRTVRFWDVKKEAATGKQDMPSPVVRVSFCAAGKKVLVEMEQNGCVLAWASHAVLALSGRPPDAAVCYTVDEAGTKLWTNFWQESQSLGRWEAIVRPEPVLVKPPPPPPPLRPRPERNALRRLPVPEPAEVATAEKKLRKELEDDFAKTALRDRTNLAGKILQYNRDGEEPAVRYAALRESRDLYADVGWLGAALDRAADLAKTFEVNQLQAKLEAFDLTVKRGGHYVINPHPVDQALALLEQAKAEGEFEIAAKFAQTARRAANRWKAPGKAELAARAEAEAAQALAEFNKAKKQMETLAAGPDNAEANLVVGRFRCFYQENWAEGLPLLAKGSDAGLKAAAEKEIQDADSPPACKKIAEAWFEQIARFPGQAQVQAALRRRAALWYRLAHPDPSVALPQDIKARLLSLAKAMPELADPWAPFNAADATRKVDYYHLDPFKAIVSKHSYKGGVDVTVVARTARTNIRIAAGDGGLCIFNHEESGGVALRRPDAGGRADGLGQRGGSDIPEGKPEATVRPNRFTLLRWRLTPTGQKVWIEGKLVYEVDETYDLSFSSPVAVGSYIDAIDVRAVIVRNVANPAPVKETKESP